MVGGELLLKHKIVKCGHFSALFCEFQAFNLLWSRILRELCEYLLYNCLFNNNDCFYDAGTQFEGSAVYSETSGTIDMQSSTFAENNATTIYLSGGEHSATNCIIRADDHNMTNVVITHSNIVPFVTGEGNISDDPIFVSGPSESGGGS